MKINVGDSVNFEADQFNIDLRLPMKDGKVIRVHNSFHSGTIKLTHNGNYINVKIEFDTTDVNVDNVPFLEEGEK